MPISPARTSLTRNYKLALSPVRALSPARLISLYRPFAVYELASEAIREARYQAGSTCTLKAPGQPPT